MAQPQTMCPKCGLSPLPEGVERCPRCQEDFGGPLTVTQSRMGLTLSRTLMGGGLQGEVTAHPGTFAIVLALSAVVWLVRASGLLVQVGDPPWLLGLAAFELGCAALLMARYGPARRAAQALAVLQLIVCLVVGKWDAVFNLFGAALAAVLLVMLFGEAGTVRRWVGLVAGVGLAAGDLTALWIRADAPPPPLLAVADPVYGASLKAPHGWELLQPEDVAPDLDVPAESGKTRYTCFGDVKAHLFGVMVVSKDEEQLEVGCPWQIKRLGGVTDAAPLSLPPPGALGQGGLLFDLRTRSGATGRIACATLGGKLVGLAVVSREREPGAGAKAFEQLALTLKVE